MGRTVAIYARVSTEHEAQLSALDNQVQYYDNLLKLHPDWKLYKQYIDEGITGTSVNKRKAFIRMMEDAAAGCFDLIVTREVSRFARNTVDTLQETRKLKKIGVEVYFTEDNIWTMNDEDGELRLTIMATLAQNESKKTSLRVKAGQMVSFQNAVPYGNGNIMGYDRVGKEYVINKEQAATVRLIYDLYLSGHGLRQIQSELEKNGHLTATGGTAWYCGVITRILKNPFYSGTIVYRKQFVPDFLEQKKINNYGDVEQIVVEGKHEPIVTKEEYARAMEIMDSKSISVSQRGRRGENPSQNIWSKKLICCCGHKFNRKVWSSRKDGTKKWSYQCYSSIRTGTYEWRKKQGLNLEGVCDVPMIQGWKLDIMCRTILRSIWLDKRQVLDIAEKLLDDNYKVEDEDPVIPKIKQCEDKLKALLKKKDNLLDLRLSDAITKDEFIERRTLIDKEMGEVQEQLEIYKSRKKPTYDDVNNRIELLKYTLENNFNINNMDIPDSVIDALFKEVVVYKDRFVVKLNSTNDDYEVLSKATSPESEMMEITPSYVCTNTGCNSTEEVIFI